MFVIKKIVKNINAFQSSCKSLINITLKRRRLFLNNFKFFSQLRKELEYCEIPDTSPLIKLATSQFPPRPVLPPYHPDSYSVEWVDSGWLCKGWSVCTLVLSWVVREIHGMYGRHFRHSHHSSLLLLLCVISVTIVNREVFTIYYSV